MRRARSDDGRLKAYNLISRMTGGMSCSTKSPGGHLGMGGVLPRTSTMTVSLTGNVAHQALSSRGTGPLAHATCPNPSDTYNLSDVVRPSFEITGGCAREGARGVQPTTGGTPIDISHQ